MDSLNNFTIPGDGKKGGYNIELKASIQEKWLCPLCNLLMKDAIQTYRGEMACESCFLVDKGDTNVCPIDHEPIEDGKFFKDRHARREILQLECYCPNRRNGCTWEDVINHVEEHKAQCSFEKITCQYCLAYVERRLMAHHFESLCPYRNVTCQYCKKICDAQSMKEHELSCVMKPIDCPYTCGERVQVNMLYRHVEKCEKVATGATCPYQLVGCKNQFTHTDELNTHLHENVALHAALTISTVKLLQEQNERIKQDLRTEEITCQELAKKVEEQEVTQKTMGEELVGWQEKFQQMEVLFVQLQDTCSSSVEGVTKNLDEMNMQMEVEDFENMNTKLAEVGQQCNEVERKLQSNAGSIIPATGYNSAEIREGITKIDNLESGSAVLSANLAELELKLQLLENTCYEGRQLWKVDNVTYRKNHAITGSVTALHSAPCYQKRGGYKFCSRLYLNGDGMGRGTHVSLFFVVMRSEYDSLMEWPFSQRVTFLLINPYNREESIRESFIPDKKSSSFKRPTKDMNIAAGCPMFIKQDLLPNFIIDDTLFIETSIGPVE